MSRGLLSPGPHQAFPGPPVFPLRSGVFLTGGAESLRGRDRAGRSRAAAGGRVDPVLAGHGLRREQARGVAGGTCRTDRHGPRDRGGPAVQSPRGGPRPRLAPGAFAAAVAAVARGQTDTIHTGWLDARRDYLAVADAVAAYRLLGERAAPGTLAHVCSGRRYGSAICSIVSSPSPACGQRWSPPRIPASTTSPTFRQPCPADRPDRLAAPGVARREPGRPRDRGHKAVSRGVTLPATG